MSRKKKRKPTTHGSPMWVVAGSIGRGNKADYEKWRSRGFYSGASADAGKVIDPKMLEASELDQLADEIIKAGSKPGHKPKTSKRKLDKAKAKGHIVCKPGEAAKEAFYKSWEWRTLRLEAIKKFGRACQCCGAQPGQLDASGNKVRICVDHIKPISRFWHLRLDRSNLQILCDECNQGKGNWDETDFRPSIPVADEYDGVDPAILEQLTDHGTGGSNDTLVLHHIHCPQGEDTEAV